MYIFKRLTPRPRQALPCPPAVPKYTLMQGWSFPSTEALWLTCPRHAPRPPPIILNECQQSAKEAENAATNSREKAWCEIVDSCAVVSQHRFQTHSTNNLTYLPKANQPLCKDGPVANIIQQEGSLRTQPGFNKDSAFVSMLSTKAWVGRVTHIVFSFV